MADIPRGVLGRHGSLTHFYPWMAQEFSIGFFFLNLKNLFLSFFLFFFSFFFLSFLSFFFSFFLFFFSFISFSP